MPLHAPAHSLVQTSANPPYRQRGRDYYEDRDNMNCQEVIPSRKPEDCGVDVIYPRRFRIDGCMVNLSAVQNVARDRYCNSLRR